jgi:hypothetical protein
LYALTKTTAEYQDTPNYVQTTHEFDKGDDHVRYDEDADNESEGDDDEGGDTAEEKGQDTQQKESSSSFNPPNTTTNEPFESVLRVVITGARATIEQPAMSDCAIIDNDPNTPTDMIATPIHVPTQEETDEILYHLFSVDNECLLETFGESKGHVFNSQPLQSLTRDKMNTLYAYVLTSKYRRLSDYHD